VAAYSDGTIRWHDVANQGLELLALFPHADQQRWVLWAPAHEELPARGGMRVHLTAVDGGLEVLGFAGNSPAAAAWIAVGDRITHLNGETVSGLAAFVGAVAS